MSGKGDTPRPVDPAAYAAGMQRLFDTHPEGRLAQCQRSVCRDGDCWCRRRAASDRRAQAITEHFHAGRQVPYATGSDPYQLPPPEETP